MQTNEHSRAYGRMLKGLILESQDAQTEAVFALREALGTADLWLIRLQVGKAYLRAGNYPEALDELTALTMRRGEATSLFLDGLPTYRVLAELSYWIGRSHEALGIRLAALASYEEFLARRPEGDALAGDAEQRIAKLR